MVTVSNPSGEEVREGSLPELPSADPTRRGAQRARSITRPSSVTRDAVTQSAQAACRTMASAVAVLDRPGSLADARPPTLREAREWHHRCAGHYEQVFMAAPRLVWGYVHLLIVVALRAVEWVTASPARIAVAAGVAAAVWYWS